MKFSSLTEMSVKFLSVGTVVTFTDMSLLPDNAPHFGNVRCVTIVQDIVEETALSVKYDMSVKYDILLLDEESEDAGFDLVRGVSPEMVEEL